MSLCTEARRCCATHACGSRKICWLICALVDNEWRHWGSDTRWPRHSTPVSSPVEVVRVEVWLATEFPTVQRAASVSVGQCARGRVGADMYISGLTS
eukprot:1337138-Amorphochlora_amoeboformis.AAC.1